MSCAHCLSTSTSKRKHRTSLAIELSIAKTAISVSTNVQVPRSMISSSRTDIVLLAVLWRLRYKLGFRDVAELLLQRGFELMTCPR